MTAPKLRRAFLRMMAEKPKSEELALYYIANVKASVTGAIEDFLQVLPQRGPVTFRDLTSGIDERMEVVVRFLAVLELFKQGLIEIDQARCFGELVVTWVMEDDREFAAVAELALSSVDTYEG
jgi:segregation and condensation protein A